MKKILISVLLAMTVLSLSWCFQKKDTEITATTQETTIETVAETTQKPYEYKNKEKEFSLQVPYAWTFKENVFGSLVMFFAPQKEGDMVKENLWVIIQELEGDINFNSYYESMKANLEDVIPAFEFVNEDIQNNQITFGYKGTQAEKVLQRQQTLILKWTTIYIFTYTAIEKTFQDLLNEVNGIIKSFSL